MASPPTLRHSRSLVSPSRSEGEAGRAGESGLRNLRKFRLTLGYRGTRYAGWAVQSASRTRGRATVQSTVEQALGRGLGHPVRITAAGRTDAGVHADAQVVSFSTSSTIAPDGLAKVLPRWLPDDVWVVDAAEVPQDFDARRSAERRWYRYTLWRDGVPPTDWQGRCLVHTDRLDLSAMRRSARGTLGRHDFASVATSPPRGLSTTRTVFAADWIHTGPSRLTFEICADAFLKQMVRGIVGSLLWVGASRWTPEQFASALGSADRRAGGPNAPAAGLTLHRIEY